MSDEFDEIVDNLKEPSAWIRLLFMLAFAAVLYIILMPVVIVIAIAQALFCLLRGEANSNLRYFASALEIYISEIVRYLAYNSEKKPFPFSSFPKLDEDEDEHGVTKASVEKAAAKKAAKKKPAATKKSQAKKKVAKKAAKKTIKKAEVNTEEKSEKVEPGNAENSSD